MKLAKTDKKILDQLLLYPPGLTLKQISFRLGIDKMHAYRRLNRMINHKVVLKISEYPAFYRVYKSQNNLDNFVFNEVICPKCGCVQKSVHFSQERKVCENKGCLTKSGHRTRFMITEDSTVSSYSL